MQIWSVTMKPFETYTPHNAHPEAGEIFAAVSEQMGYLPNVLALLGQMPHAVRAFVTLNQSFGASSLTRLEQEIVQIVVSLENLSPYCVAAHTTFAQAANVPMDEVNNLRAGRRLSNPKMEVLAEFTRTLVREKGKPVEKTRSAFLAAGYTTDQMFEVIMGISFKVFSNFLANLTKPTLDMAFAPNEWEMSVVEQAAE